MVRGLRKVGVEVGYVEDDEASEEGSEVDDEEGEEGVERAPEGSHMQI
jgi:hypothetical protein